MIPAQELPNDGSTRERDTSSADMDVDAMKKTSTRLATIGGTILLAACAIALAQYDSRKKSREIALPKNAGGNEVKPISAPVSLPGKSDPVTAGIPQPLIRANNEYVGENALHSQGIQNAQAQDYYPVDEGDANPLRDSRVVLAAADGLGGSNGPSLPSLPTSASSSLSDAGDAQAFPTPAFPGTSNPSSSSPPTDSYESTSLPALPSTSAPSDGMGAPDSNSPHRHSDGTSLAPVAAPDVPSVGSEYSASLTDTTLTSGAQQPSTLPAAPSNSFAERPPTTIHGGGLASSAPGSDKPTYQAPPQSAASLSDTQRPPLPTTDLSQTQQIPAQPQSQFPSPPNQQRASNLFTGSSAGTTPETTRIPQSAGRPTPSRQGPGVLASSAQNSTSSPTNIAGLASLVSDVPGNRYLDGPQRPDLLIEIRPPGGELQVGKKATFMVIVSNRGQVDALNVRVMDQVPRGTRYVGSEPQATPNTKGLLAWDLGTVPAGEERLIRINLVPEEEGEIGSTATVMFAAQASVRTLATQPKLELEIDASPSVLVGSNYQPRMTIRNRGSGVARNVMLEVDVPENLSHPGGRTIGAELKDMHPSESRPIDGLVFAAAAAGHGQCVIRAITDDGVQLEKVVKIEVRAPKLVAQIQGPRERYLQREAVYTLGVLNNGTAPATNLDFAVHLPAGLKYIGCDRAEAEYDRARHILHIGLTELPTGAPANFQIQLLPVELGPQSFSFKATGDLGAAAEAVSQVEVKGRAELEFLVRQDSGAIEVGATTTYEVQILNKGDKPDRNVSLQLTLPDGARIVNVYPQVKYRQQGNVVQFEPIAEMPIRDARTYRFEVEHNRSGTQKLQTQLVSENLSVGVVKEVPTFVYDDGE